MTRQQAQTWTRSATLGLLSVAVVALIPSCRDATQIVLEVHTNVPCTGDNPWQGVAVYVGKPGADVEETSPTLVTKSCDASGSVGSLVVVPSAAKDGEVGLRVVAGITRNPEQCAENGYEGCIVARRALRFTPHDSLELEVELTQACLSIGCDPQHTCTTGSCVVSRTVELMSPEEDLEVKAPSVRCGDNGARCPAPYDAAGRPTSGDVCCVTVDIDAQTTVGDCRQAADCPSTSVVLRCDDDTDCKPRDDSGNPAICSLGFVSLTSQPWVPGRVSGSACAFFSYASLNGDLALGMCQERQRCADGAFNCRESRGDPANPLPGYFWCDVLVGNQPAD